MTLLKHELQHLIDTLLLNNQGLKLKPCNQAISCLQPSANPYSAAYHSTNMFPEGDPLAELHTDQYGRSSAWEDSATIGELLQANSVSESLLEGDDITILDLKLARTIVNLAELDPSLASFYIDID